MKNPNPLAPGIYILTKDVVLPHPDRRQKHDWRVSASIEAGTRFVVEEWVVHGERGADVTITDGGLHLAGGYKHNRVLSHSEVYQALQPFLQLAPKTLGTVLTLSDVIGPATNKRPLCAIIADLIDMGKITLDDVEAAIQRDQQRWKDDDENGTTSRAFTARHGV